ncbi:MAG: histidinol-phosphatase, partial [Muribaculaceae bacterium]|nr:histidinol-phosphatase [Muribaculaceae bacterium]
PAIPYFNTLPLDYRIGSVHFIPSKRDGRMIDIDGSAARFLDNMEREFGGDIEDGVNAFFDASEAMIASGGLDIIGHFDKIIMNGIEFDKRLAESVLYQRRVNRLIDCIAAAGIVAEINTKAIDKRGRFFPDASLWPALRRAGIPLVVNSDVHYTNLVNAGRDRAFEILEGISIYDRTP